MKNVFVLAAVVTQLTTIRLSFYMILPNYLKQHELEVVWKSYAQNVVLVFHVVVAGRSIWNCVVHSVLQLSITTPALAEAIARHKPAYPR
jgi:hypothetical protein